MEINKSLSIIYVDKNYQPTNFGTLVNYPEKMINNFLQCAADPHSQVLMFSQRKRERELLVGKIIKNFFPLGNRKEFVVEHWNYHKIRTTLTLTHTTVLKANSCQQTLGIEDTFKSLERLFID